MTPIISLNKTEKPRKGFFGTVLIIAILLATTFIMASFQQPQEKTYKLEVTLEQANALVSCMEQSQAPAVTVNALIKLVAGQINPQLQAEQKKIQDSIDKSKPKPKQ